MRPVYSYRRSYFDLDCLAFASKSNSLFFFKLRPLWNLALVSIEVSDQVPSKFG